MLKYISEVSGNLSPVLEMRSTNLPALAAELEDMASRPQISYVIHAMFRTADTAEWVVRYSFVEEG